MDWKRQFLEYVEIEKGRALKTVENYDHYLTVFLNQTKAESPDEITDNTVREFRLWLNRQVTGKNIKTGQNSFAGNGFDQKSNEKISPEKLINMQ